MPRPSHLSPDNVLRFLQIRGAPASPSEIAQGLRLKKTDAGPLFKMLGKLKKRRAIEELPGGRYRLPARKPDGRTSTPQPRSDPPKQLQRGTLGTPDEVKGRLVVHHDGYGFVV